MTGPAENDRRVSIQVQRADVAFHSDVDSGRWMHTDDPAAGSWTVTVVGTRPGDHSTRFVVERATSAPHFPALGYRTFLHSWPVPDDPRGFCHVEIVDGDQDITILGRCGRGTS